MTSSPGNKITLVHGVDGCGEPEFSDSDHQIQLELMDNHPGGKRSKNPKRR